MSPYREPGRKDQHSPDCPCSGRCACIDPLCGVPVTCPVCKGTKVVTGGYEIAWTIDECWNCVVWGPYGGKHPATGKVWKQCHSHDEFWDMFGRADYLQRKALEEKT